MALRVAWGNGDPQRLQKHVAKLRASGKSYLTTASSPDVQRKRAGSTMMFDAHAPPVAFRQREQ